MKKVLSVVLSIVLMLSIMPTGLCSITANAITSGTTGECTWELNGTELVVSGNGAMGDYDYFNGKAAPWGTYITSVVIQEGVTHIGKNAFCGYNDRNGYSESNSLRSITIPNSVKSIGGSAFVGCKSLNIYITDLNSWLEISFEDQFANPMYYSNNVYLNKELLTELVVPDGVENIPHYAFCGWDSLTSITITDSVKSIGEHAFYACNGLTDVYITDLAAWLKISFASQYANPIRNADNFYLNGELLTELEIPNGVENISSFAFYNYSNLTNIFIPNTVKNIGAFAFHGCNKITSINVPESVENIYGSAFYGCSNLASITISDNLKDLGGSAFYDTAYYNNSNNWQEDVLYINNVLVECKTTKSGDYAINTGTKVIATNAFRGCCNLFGITIPDSVTSVGAAAFQGCSNLTNIAIPNGVTSIGAFTFQGCSNLTNIAIPDSVKSIGNSAFSSCSSLTSVTIPDDVESISDSMFQYCSRLENIIVPDSVKSIGYLAFSGCGNLTDVTIPEAVERIGANAFAGCSSLTDITIPDGVKRINVYTFANCSNLTSVIVPDSVKRIDASAFLGCTMLADVFYRGSIIEKASISIFAQNQPLINANWHYDICVGTMTHIYDACYDTSCNRCGKTREAMHLYEWIIDRVATCGADGSKHEECSLCHGKRNENTVIYATENHSYEWIIDKENNCGVNGSQHEECGVCHARQNENTIIEANGNHIFKSETSGVCDVCGILRIIFDPNGGTSIEAVFVHSGEATEIPSVEPTRSGYNFVGWSTSKNGEVKYQTGDKLSSVNKSAILYAQWNKICKTCNGDGIEDYFEKCYLCDGKGFETSSSVRCGLCDGDGIIATSTNVSCPSCNGSGKGTSIKKCSFCRGNGKLCNICGGYAQTALQGVGWVCSRCGVPSFRSCNSCGGQGSWMSDECSRCEGTGNVSQSGSISCYRCSGTGNGRLDCKYCTDGSNKKTRSCTACNATGEVIRQSVSAPSAPVVHSFADTVITLEEISNGEYSIDGEIWQESPVFNGLEEGKEYTFYQRYAKTDTTLSSEPSAAVKLIAHNHTYDDTCDIECNICQTIREITHTYSSDCDTICNICFDERVAIKNHTFTDGCDLSCNECDHVRILENIDVTSKPQKTEYLERDEGLDVTGGKLTLYYTDGTSVEIAITSNMVSGFNNKIVGLQTLTVTYEGFEDTYDIKIVAKSLTSISATTKPNKTTYIESTALDDTGMVLTLYYNNNTSETITTGWVSEYDFSNVGTSVVEVTYGGKTCTYDVMVIAKTLTSIVIESEPYKREYVEGDDAFDTDGLKVKAYYNNNTSEVINDYTISGYDSSFGIKTIIVGYKGKTASFEVTVLLLGDCNGDGDVDTTDLATLKLFLAGVGDLSDTGKLGADLNGDGGVNTTDLASLKLKLAGIE